jgi:hypothetical protein
MQGGGLILRSTPSLRLEIKKLGQPQQRVTIDRRSISGTYAGAHHFIKHPSRNAACRFVRQPDIHYVSQPASRPEHFDVLPKEWMIGVKNP